MTPFLSDVRILDLTRLLPGPYATQVLADLGAEVIKIEEPILGDPVRWIEPMVEGSDDVSHAFLAVNAGKKSVTLDLKEDAGRETFQALAHTADAVVENFTPGVASRLGVDYAAVRAARPDIVYCSLSGYGQDGSDLPGHDVNYIGLAGLLAMTGSPGPVIPGVPVADLAGGLIAASTIVAALYRRKESGEGAYLDISLSDVALSLTGILAGEYFGTGKPPRPDTWFLTGAYACYRVYEAADGGFVTVGALEPRLWAALCEALERPDYIPLQFSEEDREGIIADLEALFQERDRDAWALWAAERDLAVGPVLRIEEAVTNAHFLERGMIGEVEQDGAKVRRVSFPESVHGTCASGKPAPHLGEHTREVLLGLGDDPAGGRRLEESGRG